MNTDQNIFRPKPSDYHPHDAYRKDFVRDFFAVSLVTFAYMNFKKVKRVEQFDNLKDYINSDAYTDTEKSLEFFHQNDCFFNTLIDSILISISFENYFKAKLLLNDIVIHEVDKNINGDLFNKQKNRPISKIELKSDSDNNFYEIKTKTLVYSLILGKNEYVKYYNLDKKNIEYLQEVNDRRNNLHFYMNETSKFSKAEINNLENIKEIVELDFAVLNNTLLDKLGGESRTRIPIKKK